MTGLVFFLNPIFAQFTDSDVTLTITGLSATNSQKFKENKKVFIDALNNSGLPSDIKPLKLEINYKENAGSIKLTINFDSEKIYSENSQYKRHGNQYQAFGKGISFYFHHQIMLCISEYKLSAARDGYSVKADLANFESILCLKKSSGDIMYVYAYNRFSGGLFPYYFNSNVDMKISGKNYSTECGNLKTLNDMKHFFVNDLEETDGQKTGAYYFCKFYNITVD